MNIQSSGDRWYALQLRTRWEGSTATLLSGKGYETFLPTCKTLKQVCGRSTEVSAPLFPGYVFCRFDAHNRLPILVTPGDCVRQNGRTHSPGTAEHLLPLTCHTLASVSYKLEERFHILCRKAKSPSNPPNEFSVGVHTTGHRWTGCSFVLGAPSRRRRQKDADYFI